VPPPVLECRSSEVDESIRFAGRVSGTRLGVKLVADGSGKPPSNTVRWRSARARWAALIVVLLVAWLLFFWFVNTRVSDTVNPPPAGPAPAVVQQV
jgi:hypothetical protein